MRNVRLRPSCRVVGQGPPKKRKTAHSKPGETLAKSAVHKDKKGKGKEKAFERKFIPIPLVNDDDGSGGSDVSDEDIAFFRENLDGGGAFLGTLDRKAIARCVSYLFY